MLKLRDFYGCTAQSPQEKEAIIECFPAPEKPGQEIATFLYMHGDNKGWRPGPIGATAGALIYPSAREYFRKHF